MTNIILCGGSGTRLWPISRTLMPKQFVKMFNNQSLFQLTVKRNKSLCSKTFIVSNSEQYFLALDQLEELALSKKSKYLLEPLARNTAPAIALACFALSYDEILLVTPSDHLIKNQKEYKKVLQVGKELAQQNFLVTFGITPTYPETGFGYIEANNFDVKAFHEKPDDKTANLYLEHGNYFWNSGMFCFKAGVFLDELKKYSPEIYETSLKAFLNANKENLIRIKHEEMLNIPENSIDYAVMEKSSIVKVVPSNIDWSDLGSFDSLYEHLPKDENGNTLNQNHISYDSQNNLIYGKERKIATIGIDNLIVVDTSDALLISKKGSSQKVRKIVNDLKNLEDTELHNLHLTVHRPWGTYTILEEGNNYKIKKLVVNSHKSLSLQKHFYRSEHWVVVSGSATVMISDEVKILNKNESTFINIKEQHKLSNNTNKPLIIIETQVGEYLGEDDIVRLDNQYIGDIYK